MIIKNLTTEELSIISQDLWDDIFSKTNNHKILNLDDSTFDSFCLYSVFDASICKYVARLTKTEFDTYLKCDKILSIGNPHIVEKNHLYYIDKQYPNYCGEFEYYRIRYYIDF
jgi:hypothetical protein